LFGAEAEIETEIRFGASLDVGRKANGRTWAEVGLNHDTDE